MSSANAFYVAVHRSEQERGKVYKETTLLGNRAAAEICRQIQAGSPAGASDPSKGHASSGSFEHSAIWRCYAYVSLCAIHIHVFVGTTCTPPAEGQC